MADSKIERIELINQPALKYNCGAGIANVNLYTGRMLFLHPDASIGFSNNQVEVSHIYNTQLKLPDEINTQMGRMWKLNVQQYLFMENGEYIYIDATGYRHKFNMLTDKKYYDTSGQGFILTDNAGNLEIADKALNRMVFESNRLVKFISCEDPGMVKYFDYDSSGKLTSVYDGRRSEYKILFNYENDLLKTITVKSPSKIIEVIEYFYNSNNDLFKITRTADNITKINALFSYNNDYLIQTTHFEDLSTLGFEYSNDMISLVKTGIANIIIEAEERQANHSLNGIYCGDDLICGEIDYDEEFSNNVSVINLISKNEIVYNDVNTIVTNEKNIKMVYYFNGKGFTTTVFEAEKGIISDLRIPKKLPGIPMISNGTGSTTINQNTSHVLSTKDLISKDNILANNFTNIDNYRKYKCLQYIHFTCSFFLKIKEPMSSSKIAIQINMDEYVVGTNRGSGTFDNSAVNSWQYVTIPITITSPKIDTIHISFSDNSDKSYEIADMRFCYSSSLKYCITQETQWKSPINMEKTPLDKVKKIKYVTAVGQQTIENNINESFYLSAMDLQETYLSKFKEKGNSFILSLCDNTKRIAVDSVTLFTNDSEFQLSFGFDEYGTSSRAQFLYEITSPDGNLHSYGIPHFYRSKNIGSKTYDCMSQLTESIKTDADGKVLNKSQISSYIDFKGKLLKEIDEYGIETIFDYDKYGSQIKRTIQNKDKTGITDEKLIFTSNTVHEGNNIENTDFKSYVKTEYKDSNQNVNRVWYNGIDENRINILDTSFTYDRFNDKLLNLNNNENGGNYMIYGGGKLLEVTPIGWNNDNAYGYKFGYNSLGDPDKYYFTYKEGNKKTEKLLVNKNIDRENGIITTEKYRDTTTDKTILALDKYGKTNSFIEDGLETTFKRQDLVESSGASEVTEMYDPFENQTYLYKYDDFNNVTGYEIKEGSAGGTAFLSISSNGNGKTKYLGMNTNNEFYHESEISFDESKLISPRIIKSKSLRDLIKGAMGVLDAKQVDRDETTYGYDHLGRINHKEQKVFDGILGTVGAYTSITENTLYKPNTLLKEEIMVKIDNPSSGDAEYAIGNTYDKRGNITISSFTKNSIEDGSFSESYVYTYDKANRLTSEKNTAFGNTLKSYSYNKDGTIDTESDGTTTRKNVFKNGRLVNFHNTNAPLEKTSFSYDSLGNCTHYMRDSSLLPNMEWERGNLLKKYNTTTYLYNSQGTRFKKELSNGSITTYFLDGDKILGEKSSTGKTIRYMYDAEGLKGFKISGNILLPSKNDYPYHYVKDATGNIVAILDKDKEVAHYEYDAWGNCKIVKETDGIGTLNPFRWKGQYYDNESGLYYMGGRYYSPAMKSFISPCNFDEILYNIDVPGGLNAYTIGNPMYFPAYSYNIFTSIPLVPENIGSGGESDFWRFLGSVGRFVGGAIITVGGALLTYTSASFLLVPGLSIIPQFGITMTIYGAYMTASSWDSQIKADMDRIGWNPFNSNEEAVLKSNNVSFYKGSAVIRHSIPETTSCSIGGVVFLNRNTTSVKDVKHEWGHSVQSWALGIWYIPIIAIPSVINFLSHKKGKLKHDYYWYPWESTADWFGGVTR